MPRGRKRRTRAEVIDHLAASYEIDEAGCWVWGRPLTTEGYGRMTWQESEGRVEAGAHRLVLHVAVEPVPVDMVIDHLCRNRACINPDHLDVVKQRENVMRSPVAQGALNAAKTHCAQGHPFSPENTYVWRHTKRSTTVRICRACSAERRRRSQLRSKEQAA